MEPSRAQQLAQEASAYPENARAAFLMGACGSDEALRESVEELLNRRNSGADATRADGAHTLLDTTQPPQAAASDEVEGAVIGRYRLIKTLGEGGFGKVWLADQRQPVRRSVALKIIKLGMDTEQVVARFGVERQALALMDHPNIAKVLDAGTTRTGRPYFVMELVEGQPITAFCDARRMPTRERLELFIKVCQAIQHAHQKGIIHRDIKPSNILVTRADGGAVPKVIDFGIAKATQQDLTDQTVVTHAQQVIGTPAYMSPEQADTTGLDIDTRSDIYSLGVVLYQLLTGVTPFDGKELMASGMDEMRRTIREKEPLRPSARLQDMGEKEGGTTMWQGADLVRQVHLLRGDLDWIAVKCLEKDRTRRYETANALAQEVQRYLNEEPIRARPPSGLYRFQKTVRRNKVLFAAIGAVAAALVVGLVFSTVLYLRESEARRLAERAQQEANIAALKSRQVATFLKDMLRGVGPSVAQGRDTTMLKEILEATATRVGKDLRNQQDIQAELRTVIGSTYAELGDHSRAEEMHREALKMRQAAYGDRHPSVAESLAALGRELRERGNYGEAEKVFREAVSMNTELGRTNSRASADALNGLAVLLVLKGNLSEARRLQSQSVEIYRSLYGESEPRLADLLNDMGVILFDDGRGDLAAAEVVFQEALRIRRQHSGNLSIMNSMMLHNLGRIQRGRGDLQQSESTFREALELLKKMVGEDHPRTAITLHELALTLLAKGDPSEAEKLLSRALGVYRRKLGDSHAYVAEALNDLGRNFMAQRRYKDAAASLDQAVAMRKQVLGAQHLEVATSLRELAAAETELGNPTRGTALLEEALEIFRQGEAQAPTQLAADLGAVAGVFRRAANWPRAEALLLEALPLIQGNAPRELAVRREIQSLLAGTYEDWDKADPTAGKASLAEEWKRKPAAAAFSSQGR